MDWWWPGLLIQFAVFMVLLVGFVWGFTRWATRHVERHLDALDEEYRQRLKRDEEDQ